MKCYKNKRNLVNIHNSNKLQNNLLLRNFTEDCSFDYLDIQCTANIIIFTCTINQNGNLIKNFSYEKYCVKTLFNCAT